MNQINSLALDNAHMPASVSGSRLLYKIQHEAKYAVADPCRGGGT